VKYALVVVGNGRPYLHDTVPAALDHIDVPLAAKIMVNDGTDSLWADLVDKMYFDFTVTHTHGQGVAYAVQTGFTTALESGADFAIWIEDDMLITRDLPIAPAAAALHTHPMTIAQMSFRREPWWGSPLEMEHGDQLAAICAQAPSVHKKHGYTLHNFLFSLNPCVIPAAVMGLGWPSGPLGEGNEAGMTTRLRDLGYVFGSWGHPNDGQTWARHIGETRGAGWQL
jgi:hypothetical protein